MLLVGMLQGYQLLRDTPAEYVILKAKPYPKNNLEKKEIKGFKFYYSHLNNTLWDQFPASYYMIDSVTLRTQDVRDGFKVESKLP